VGGVERVVPQEAEIERVDRDLSIVAPVAEYAVH
jgi:hypothetical protein